MSNMEQRQQQRNSTDDEPSIHYVVPDGSNDNTGAESHELQVYVSTTEGLKKVERTESSSSR